MNTEMKGAKGVSLLVEGLLGRFYPNGIDTKVLRKQLEEHGFTAKEISNGVYKLTSGGIVERDKEDDCFYLVNDPTQTVTGRKVVTPQSRLTTLIKRIAEPALEQAAVAETPKVTPTPIAEPVTVTPINEPAVLSAAELDALASVNRPSQPLDPALQALSDLGDRYARLKEMRPVERADYKERVLIEVGKLLDDDRLTLVLNEICEDLGANAA